ncbi:hypothetical protein D1227_06215 [Henriciella mobilis]|uniref:hypothetical protein n=1 Tax=Henriciella mobilis TaxID=2305467 RepID=UPI000E662AC4|nr:hypothetical protein [Henriciella mobilis]RIJ15994.1 hypothetical protein D1231_09385 [Henriciella mobilis]RIJ21204.1 hypothetical protein D1227_12925 [Henriciella mobilis]RIJ23095.1 hypothetical protein D1227_06215 [Henriciella mobilis]
MADTATIGHNSAAVGEMLAEDPALIFRDPSMLDALVREIEGEIEAREIDTETDKGRKAIASLAYSIARRKAALDDAGKALNEDHRKAINAVDAVRRDLRDRLDSLKTTARKPLDEWEAAEEKRKMAIDRARSIFRGALGHFDTIEAVERMREQVQSLIVTEEVFGVQYETAAAEQKRALESLNEQDARIDREINERAELEKLRAEKEERERAEREKAKKEAAEKAEAERIECERKKAADEAAEAERRKHEAALEEERRKSEAAQAELDRQKREREQEAAAKAKREADQAHRSKIMTAAKEAIMEHGGIGEDRAKKIVLAIVAGSVPNVEVRF